MKRNFHLLGLSRSISAKWFSACPFTHNLLGVAEMLYQNPNKASKVYHYGAEGSEVACDEHVDVVFQNEMEDSFGVDFREQKQYITVGEGCYAHDIFNLRAVNEIKKRAKKGDFLLCFAGPAQKVIADQLEGEGLVVVEPAAGYPNVFCRARVFPSSSWMHYQYGRFHQEWERLPEESKKDSSKWTVLANPYSFPKREDAMIHHWLDMEQFEYSETKEDYFVHISRITPSKGIEMAVKACEYAGVKLKIAGQGNFKEALGFDPPSHVELLGVLGPEARNEVMGGAIGGFALSQYNEPFGLVPIEYGACGTPAITSNWGAYLETINHGYNGYRTTHFYEVVDAIKNIGAIKPEECRKWVESKFTIETARPKYLAYFESLSHYLDGVDAGEPLYYMPNME